MILVPKSNTWSRPFSPMRTCWNSWSIYSRWKFSIARLVYQRVRFTENDEGSTNMGEVITLCQKEDSDVRFQNVFIFNWQCLCPFQQRQLTSGDLATWSWGFFSEGNGLCGKVKFKKAPLQLEFNGRLLHFFHVKTARLLSVVGDSHPQTAPPNFGTSLKVFEAFGRDMLHQPSQLVLWCWANI